MAPLGSRLLVVDTDILAQAGSEGVSDSRSKHCYDFLRQILEICHRVLLSEALSREWKSHASPRARTWLTQMHGSKKVEQRDVPPDPNLRRSILRTATNKEEAEAMEKDAHLLEAAIEADGLIASNDDEARGLFKRASQRVRQLRHLSWVNPSRMEENPIGWLKDGAPAEKKRQLGHDEANT